MIEDMLNRRDITSRESSDAALKASEERYRILFESSRDALMTLAPPSWRFTSGNQAVCEMFGVHDEADFISRSWSGFYAQWSCPGLSPISSVFRP